jgi:hypothetical protein
VEHLGALTEAERHPLSIQKLNASRKLMHS